MSVHVLYVESENSAYHCACDSWTSVSCRLHRYAHLTSKAPIRLRTGVLLYGPPGCGKTHVVNAAVAAAGMRVVSVKGPEVLNKYIGASEAAVRDLFRYEGGGRVQY